MLKKTKITLNILNFQHILFPQKKGFEIKMNLKTLISKEELDKRIQEIANQITEDYKNQEVIIVCILTGAVYFATDLTKYIKNDTLKIEFMKVSSYGNSKESTGEVKIKKDLENSISGKNVIIVEDIIDTGLTMKTLKKYLLEKNPASLKICTL